MSHDKFSFLIILYQTYLYALNSLKRRVPSWSWSYGRWIYNYLCNQCLSTLKLFVWTLFMSRSTRYDIIWNSLSKTCGFLQVPWFHPPIKLITDNILIVAISFIRRGKQSTRGKTPTCHKSLTKIYGRINTIGIIQAYVIRCLLFLHCVYSLNDQIFYAYLL